MLDLGGVHARGDEPLGDGVRLRAAVGTPGLLDLIAELG
jgi:hypothetical protein